MRATTTSLFEPVISEQYFETLAGTLDAVIDRALKSGIVLTRLSDVWSMCQEPLSYGQVRRADFSIDSIKGAKTKKFFHAIITRLDTGRYELLTYVL